MFPAVSALQAQTTWYVDDNAPGDPGPGDPDLSDPLENGSSGRPFDAIQEGMDAASSGDTVLVADGTYTETGNRDLDFNGKAITVRSESGFESCIIYCDGTSLTPYRGFHFHSGETSDSVLQGFTIQRGYATGPNEEDRWGGGICCVASSPTITGNKIFDNGATNSRGGGIYCRDASPVITGNTISENTNGIGCYQASPLITGNKISDNYRYGGIYCYESSPEIMENTISGNGHSEPIGGIRCEYASPWIHHNTISENESTGLICEYGAPVISDNQITGNYGHSSEAGGIYCLDTDALIIDNIIQGNSISHSDDEGGIHLKEDRSVITGNIIADHEHGGLLCSTNSDISVTDNIFLGNHTGIICEDSSVLIKNNLIALNQFYGVRASEFAIVTMKNNTITNNVLNAIYAESEAHVTVINSIFWENTGYEIVLGDDYPVVNIRYSDVDGGLSGVYYLDGTGSLQWGAGMINADPLFMSGPEGDHYLSQTTAGNPSDSPCVNAGTPGSSWFHGTTRTDEAADAGIIDMGFHYQTSHPALRNGSVTPDLGYYGTQFEYTVDYYDPDGDEPALITAVIDGTPFNMTLSDGSASDGSYAYATRDISTGSSHEYYFYVENGEGESSRTPDTGGFSGPIPYDPELYMVGTPGPGEWITFDVWGIAGGMWAVAASPEPGPFYVPATGLTFDVGPDNIHLVKKIAADPLNLDEYGYGSVDVYLPLNIPPGTRYIQGATRIEQFWGKTNRITLVI